MASLRGRLGCRLAASGILLLAGCGDNALPPSPPVLNVTMREFRFDYSGAPIAKGRVVFRAVNAGRLYHRLAVVPLPADLPPIDVQLRGTARRYTVPLAGIPDGPAGSIESLAVDLLPGRYAFICYTIESNGLSHAALGMASEFRVQ